MENKWALFDFCETLVNIQTANAFVKYVRIKHPTLWASLLNAFYVFLVRVRFWNFTYRLFPKQSIDKRFYLLQLKGISLDILEKVAFDFYNEIIKSHFIDKVLDELKSRQKNGYKIAIISGGYDLYLKYFCHEYKVDNLICSNIGFDYYKRCLGAIEGKDCMYDEKVIKILNTPKINLVNSIAYSDSITDLPFLNLATEAVVISHLQSQSWVRKYNFKEIIW